MLKHFLYLSIITSCALASGYKISEQSGDSIALSSSNVATSFGADASYYNPANMAFISDPRHIASFSGTYIHLEKSRFNPDVTTQDNYYTVSKYFDTFMPTFHMVSLNYFDNVRFGLSITVPAGLTMKWDDSYPASTGKLFALKVMEANPTMSVKLSDQFALGFGARLVYSKGKVKNNVKNQRICPGGTCTITLNASRDLHGDDIGFGYNLAATYRPIENLSFAATYRSKVDLKLKGHADIKSSSDPQVPSLNGKYNGDVSVTIPLPASFALATSYKIEDFTLLFSFERTFWSKLKEFDFMYPQAVVAGNLFDKPVERSWRDTNAYRFGIAYDATDALTLMAGFAYDENAAQSDKVGFELPETSARMYSTGLTYKITDDMKIGFSYLYLDRENKHLSNNHHKDAPFSNLKGYMKAADVHMFNASLEYRF